MRSDSSASFYYVSALAIDPFNTQTIYVSDAGIAKSTDGGESWNALIRQPGTSGVSSVVVDPVHPNVIYAGTYGDGVFRSADGGATWNPLNDGLTNLNISVLAIDASGNFLHAGTPAGVFDYQNSAAGTPTPTPTPSSTPTPTPTSTPAATPTPTPTPNLVPAASWTL